MMYCKNCGNELEEGDKFCGKCGQAVPQKSIRTTKIILLLLCLMIVVLVSGGFLGITYYNNTTITEKYIADKLINENGFSQFDDLEITIFDIEDINYENYTKLVFLKEDITYNDTSTTITGFMLVNKETDTIGSFTINSHITYILNGLIKNDVSQVDEITKTSVNYIQEYGTDIFNSDSDNFSELIDAYSSIIGLSECKEYVKSGVSEKVETTYGSNLDYTLLFEKDSPIVKYVAFYETTTKYNWEQYAIPESSYEELLEYSDKSYNIRSQLRKYESLFGPPYITVNEYSVYKIDGDKEVGTYTSLETAKEKLNVEE